MLLQILALEPQNIEARLGLANALVLQKKNEGALGVLRSLASANLNIEQRYRRCTIYGSAGDSSEAVRELVQLEGQITNTDWLKNGLAWAMSSEMLDLAVHLADRVLESKNAGASLSEAEEAEAA